MKKTKRTKFFVPLFKSFKTILPKRVVTALATFFLVINQVIIPVQNPNLLAEEDFTVLFVESSGDAHISKANPNANFGNADLVTIDGQDVNGDPNTELRGLIKWDLSQIPAGSVLQSAKITLHIVNHSASMIYTLHKMTENWSEASATWNTESADFESTPLGIMSSNALGTNHTLLNSQGVAVIQDWVANPSSNFGFLILPDPSSTNGFEFKSSNSSIKPILELAYTPPQTASYNVEMNVSGNGTIFVSPEQPFGFDDEVTFTAEANDGWQFGEWQGDITGNENPKTIQIQSNMNITAVFTLSEPTPPVTACGDGVLDDGEQCDGSNLAGQSCSTLGNGSGTLACSSDCKFNMGNCSFAWPAEAWNQAQNLTPLEGAGANDFHFNLSGAAWNPISRKLWVVRNGGTGGSKLWALKEDGSGGFEVDYKSGLRGEWSNFGDLEAVALADFNNPDVVYLLIEGEERIKRYNVSTYGTAILERNWNTSPNLPLNGGSGAEALTFIPDSFLTAQGFVDPAGNPRISQNGMGGLMFVGHQNGGRIYVFDLNPNNDTFTFVGAYKTNFGETADLAFDRSTGYLYAFHGADYNHTEVMSLASTMAGSERKMVTLVDYASPMNGNLEGISLLETADCVNGKRSFFLTIDDGGANSLFRFRNFPCGLAMNKVPVISAGSDQTITLPATAALNATVTDDRLPNGNLSTSWMQTGFVPASGVTGSGTATFANPTTLTPTATFNLPGIYTIRLTANDGELSASDDVMVTVNAAPPATFTITASASSHGSISPSGSTSVNAGSNQTYTITPNADYHVADVLVDGTSVGEVTSHTFSNITANHTIAATFAINTHTITTSTDGNGTISPNGSVSVNHGASQTFAITPNDRYAIRDVLVDGVSVGAVSAYTFNNVTSDRTIVATFNLQTHTLSVAMNRSVGGAVVITPDSPGGIYADGTEVTLTAIANPGNAFSDWAGDASGPLNPVTITMDSDKQVMANFDLVSYSVNVQASNGGTVGLSSEGPYYLNDIVTLTATPDSIHTFSGWSGDVSGSENPISVTVTGNMNITANFTPITYTLNVTTIGNGTVTKNPNMINYPAGTPVTLTATPARFWNFLRWTGNASGNNPVITVIMDSNKNVQARFKQGLSGFGGGTPGPAS